MNLFQRLFSKWNRTERHITPFGQNATIQRLNTPWLLVKEKYIVHIYAPNAPLKVVYRKRVNDKATALEIIKSWQPPTD